ncbi:MAG TPA: hypothetical protein PLL30_02135 [Candidatus Krumholzibacteria bacterium]|nr:hypothetical protein [Candidatus Krumholzibacteria bacterium]HPD70566.1 hypothetical protein [Candidatus Krumholzibacteria bacterium]HRY39734.1 hypothetical protein [Candidatus Krumholzibacteria bacterium]
MATLRIRRACGDGGKHGRVVAVMAFATCTLSYATLGGIARAECIDCGSYLHWVGGVDTPGYAHGVSISGSYAYVVDLDAGLQVIDITDPASPQLVGGVGTSDWAYSIAVSGSHAYVAAREAGLQVIDITDPVSPQLVGGVDTPDAAWGVAISGSHAYVADGSAGLQVAPLQCNIVGVESPDLMNVSGLYRLANHPNPFNPSTTIVYEILTAGPVRLQVFDLRGHLVRTLRDEWSLAGRHAAQWDGRDRDGRDLPSAVYLSRLHAGGKVALGRMTLVR